MSEVGTSVTSGSSSPPVPESRGRRVRVDSEDGLSDAVITVVWSGGKVGIAYYMVETAEIYVLPDTAEAPPDFYVVRSLFRQINPRFFVISGSQDYRFLKVCIELCGEDVEVEGDNEQEDAPAQPSSQDARGRTQLIKMQSKVFNPDACRSRVMSVKLPYEPKDLSEEEHQLFLSTVIPSTNERMMRAAGALLSFLDKRGREMLLLESVDGHIPVIDIKLCNMNDVVMIDETAWHSLQIFSVDMHPSTVKQMKQTGSKEGVSVFSTLNQHCSTAQGMMALRLMLLRPSRDVKLLKRRFDVIEYACEGRNMEFTKAAVECLKNTKSISVCAVADVQQESEDKECSMSCFLQKLLYRISSLHASVNEWKDLYRTLDNCVLLGQICSAQPNTIELFQELADTERLIALRDLTYQMVQVIDFEESGKVDRIVSKEGIDPQLDSKKRQLHCLPNIMSLVATEEMDELPEEVKQCSVVYIPEVGYLLSVVFWKENLTDAELEALGPSLEFKFCNRPESVAYYRSPRTKELDVVLGDCSVAILQMETGIVVCLTERILNNSMQMLKMGSLIAELDALISMAEQAKSGNYVRPRIVDGSGRLKIINGRHPIVESLCQPYMPNTTHLNGAEKISIITGPNASGKSVYLKQVGVITIMALSGSFVPATLARIPTFDRICTRIHASESVSSGFSSFMMDLTQMSLTLRTTTRQSLAIIDEFGKGTAEADGLSLLVASVNEFIGRERDSPTVFISTHFFSMINYLDPSPLVKMQSMKILRHKEQTYESVTYLYELIDGVCQSSLASMVASQVGIPSAILDRSKRVEEVVRHQYVHGSLEPWISSAGKETQDSLISMADAFLDLDMAFADPVVIMSRIKEFVTP